MASDINYFPAGAQYIGFCGWNRVFIADSKIVEQMRIRYHRVSPTEQPTGYESSAHYADTGDVTGAEGNRPLLDHQPV